MQAYSDTASSRRHSLDIHELMKSSSPSWPRQSLNAKDEDRESKSGEWIDKHEESIQDENVILPEKFYQSMAPQQQSLLYVTRIASTKSFLLSMYLLVLDLYYLSNDRNGGKQDFEVQSITDNESDEGAPSDCSDTDLMWRLNVQVNVPRVSNIQNSVNPKQKKIEPRTAKLSETR